MSNRQPHRQLMVQVQEERVPRRQRGPTEADILLWEQLGELNPPSHVGTLYRHKEFRFAIPRKWRFDFAIQTDSGKRIAIEIEGGAFTQGRHTRGQGFINDCEKYNFAAMCKWLVLRFTPTQVLRGEAIAFIKLVLEVT